MKQGLHQAANFLGLTVTALGALLGSGAALALECNTMVNVPGTTLTLNEDMVCRKVGDVGITVEASDVIIDLNGHTISGFKKENSVGIRIDGGSGITVMNGTLEFFERGLFIASASDVDVTNVTSRGNRKDGVRVQSGMDVGLMNNELLGNTNGIVIRDGDNLRLLGNEARDNSQVDFDIAGATRATFSNNESSGGAQRAAFRTVGPAGVTFAANVAKGFKGFGFQFDDSLGVVVTADDGGNKATGKPSKACFPDPCPLDLK